MGSTAWRRRPGRVSLRLLVAIAAVATAPSAAAVIPTDDCGQRIIRDWRSGGRVDDMYPLACYRAALRALPEDVRQYSNAEEEIRRALAFARRARNDAAAPPADDASPLAEAGAKATRTTESVTPGQRARDSSAAATTPVAAPPPRTSPPTAPATASAGAVPTPVLLLAALALVLLGTGAVGWIADRRRR